MNKIYDFLLVDWISMGLNKKTLAKVVEAVKDNQDLEDFISKRESNQRYIEKILREEVSKQFRGSDRPMLEVVLNSIDAKPIDSEEDYKVNVKIKKRSFTSEDNGRGMSLEDILQFLLIPFNTEKVGIEEIGRFGVGFLSSFNYCLHEPNKVHVLIDSVKDNEAYHLDFYAKGEDIKDLRMSLAKNRLRRKQGTKVKIKRKNYCIVTLKSYLETSTKHVPPYKAHIFINKKPINFDEESKWYHSDVILDIRGKKIKQKVGLKPNPSHPTIFLTSQGVNVSHFKDILPGAIGATISFPSGVKVVEGRDEFKIDDNYHKSVKAVFKASENYLKDINFGNGDRMLVQKIADFFPSLMSVFEIKSIKDAFETESGKTVSDLDEIRNSLFPGKEYVLTPGQYLKSRPFFGKKLDDIAFEASSQACTYWKELYLIFTDLLNNHFEVEHTFSKDEFTNKFIKDSNFYPNLHLLGKEIRVYDKNELSGVRLLKGPTDTGQSILIYGGNLYINVNHRHVHGVFSPAKTYSVISDYAYLTSGRRGEESESHIMSNLVGELHRFKENIWDSKY
jgi:hypothetical protein